MTEAEFRSLCQDGKCAPDIMAEAVGELLRSLGCSDAARIVPRYLLEQSEEPYDWHGECIPSDERLILENAIKLLRTDDAKGALAVMEEALG